MDKDLFINNIIHFSTLKREYPTRACEAAGVGKSFISNIRRGQMPSVEKVKMLADYLGVTTSQLLGEETKKEPDGENAVELPDPLDAQLMDLLRRAVRSLWTCYAGLILRRSLRCLFFYSSGKKTNKLAFFIVRQCGKQCNDLVIQISGHCSGSFPTRSRVLLVPN